MGSRWSVFGRCKSPGIRLPSSVWIGHNFVTDFGEGLGWNTRNYEFSQCPDGTSFTGAGIGVISELYRVDERRFCQLTLSSNYAYFVKRASYGASVSVNRASLSGGGVTSVTIAPFGDYTNADNDICLLDEDNAFLIINHAAASYLYHVDFGGGGATLVYSFPVSAVPFLSFGHVSCLYVPSLKKYKVVFPNFVSSVYPYADEIQWHIFDAETHSLDAVVISTPVHQFFTDGNVSIGPCTMVDDYMVCAIGNYEWEVGNAIQIDCIDLSTNTLQNAFINFDDNSDAVIEFAVPDLTDGDVLFAVLDLPDGSGATVFKYHPATNSIVDSKYYSSYGSDGLITLACDKDHAYILSGGSGSVTLEDWDGTVINSAAFSGYDTDYFSGAIDDYKHTLWRMYEGVVTGYHDDHTTTTYSVPKPANARGGGFAIGDKCLCGVYAGIFPDVLIVFGGKG